MKEKLLLENIDHHTLARPFSLHRTIVDAEDTNALYVHCHPESEIFYLQEGRLDFYVEDRIYPLKAGEAIFIPAYLVHYARKEPAEPCQFSAVVFSEKWLFGYQESASRLSAAVLQENRYDCVYPIRQQSEEEREALQCIRRWETYMEQPLEEYEWRLQGELLLCFQMLYNRHFCRLLRGGEHPAGAGIQKSLDYINEHYMENLTLEELAEQSSYSVGHFGHRFKERTGYAPFEYLNRIRVIKAAERLVLSREKITRIAGDCGFNNISYFNRVFVRMMGMTPGKYRKNYVDKAVSTIPDLEESS